MVGRRLTYFIRPQRVLSPQKFYPNFIEQWEVLNFVYHLDSLQRDVIETYPYYCYDPSLTKHKVVMRFPAVYTMFCMGHERQFPRFYGYRFHMDLELAGWLIGTSKQFHSSQSSRPALRKPGLPF